MHIAGTEEHGCMGLGSSEILIHVQHARLAQAQANILTIL